MTRLLCSDLSYEELVRFLSPARRRAYWYGRQINWFRLRKLGYKTVYRVWRSSKEQRFNKPSVGINKPLVGIKQPW